MTVSSSVLVHQTKTKENLKGILIDGGFNYKFCREETDSIVGRSKIAFPMVSFTDLPLSRLKFLLDKPGHYGPYGIGLKKNWANRNRLNPVLYFDRHSVIFDFLNGVRVDLVQSHNPIPDFSNEGVRKVVFDLTLEIIFSYSKNYSGTLVLENETIPNYKFADEKEWRRVIHAPELNLSALKNLGIHNFLNVESEDYGEKKKDWDAKLRDCDFKLRFSQEDIEYIIVSQNSEIPYFIDLIKEKYGDTIETQTLLTRLISTQQIINDF